MGRGLGGQRGTGGIRGKVEDRGDGDEGKETYIEPEHPVAVDGIASAASKLFVAGGFDEDGVFEGACLGWALASLYQNSIPLLQDPPSAVGCLER